MNNITLSNASRQEVANAIARIESASYERPFDNGFEHDRVSEANANLFDSSHLSEPLTTYAVGWQDDSGLDEALEFFAPEVPVGQRFEWMEFNNPDEFETDADDERAIGGDFKQVGSYGVLRNDKLANRGLQICIDQDEANGDPNHEERKTGMLIRRIKRNALIRATTLLDVASPSVALTWDTTSGRDPDQDLEDMLAAAGDSSGMDPNRVAVGRSAWLKRKKSHRAQNSAGGFASASMTPADLGSHLGIDDLFVPKSRYGTGATKTRLIGDSVLAFTAENGLSYNDPSNIKRFYQMLEGMRYRVYRWQDGPKKIRIAVEHYERTRITSLLGLAKRAIS